MKMYPDEMTLANMVPDRRSGIAESRAEARPDFEQLFDRYRSMVFQLAYRILAEREEALDVTQEVFLSVYRKLDRFRGEASIRTWIYRIAVNKASNRCRWWRRLRRRGTVSLEDQLSNDHHGTLADTLAAGGQSPEEALLLREAQGQLEGALVGLPLQQRIAVVMRDIEGLSYEEIAEATRASLGTVKSRIARGRDELKRRLNAGWNAAAGVNRRLQ